MGTKTKDARRKTKSLPIDLTMPPLLTFVARLSDGLPLVANTAPDFSQGGVTQEHKAQAKDILRGLGGTASSSARMSIEDTANNLVFHYLVRDSLCYLTLAEHSYPKRLAFLYLGKSEGG